MNKMRAHFLLFMTIGALFASVLGATLKGNSVSAASATGFNASYIISDNIFTNSQTMNPSQIQAFLNSKVPTCDTQGRQAYAGTTRAAYASSRGVSTPFTCLKDYSENGTSSAQIIYNIAQQFQINPQVLIVMLQKEQGLVTDDWPWPIQYRSATGYGCPDTAPCDSQYYGLTNQLTWSAKMFRAIMNNSSDWYTPYVLGNNSIRWNPSASCGSSVVNIQNRATQALYNYTPYQPNQAALNAGYGTGDSCSSYGNRNFYLYFSDWFGSPQYGSLVRTVENATVYLVSGDNKYPIADINTLNALYPLGGISFVNQSYLNTKTTGQVMSRIIRSTDGTIYFYDAGIKLPFGSCTQVAAYGSTCGQAIQVEDYQTNQLFDGPNMTNVFATTSGKRFYIDGTKHEVYDNSSLSQAGIPGLANVLNESAIANLQYGTPIMRSDVMVRDRSANTAYAYSSGSLSKVDGSVLQGTYLNQVPAAALDSASITTLPKTTDVTGYIKASNGTSYLLTSSGKYRLSSTTEWQQTFQTVSDGLLAQIPDLGVLNPPYLLKPTNSGTVYYLSGGAKRPILGWADLLLLSPSPTIVSITDYYVNSLRDGAPVLSPGGLVKSSQDATVYMVDGLDRKIPLTSFNPANELGAGDLRVVSDDELSAYTTISYTLSPTVKCGANQGLAIGGSVYTMTLPSTTYLELSTLNCARLNWKATPSFLLGSNGTIYRLESGQKRPISGYQMYLSLGGNSSNTARATDYILGFFPTGSVL